MTETSIKKSVKEYIDYLNKQLNENINIDIKEATILRCPMYANCQDNAVYIWTKYYSNLSDVYRKNFLIHAYSLLYDAYKFGKKIKEPDIVTLKVDPNIIAKEICSLVGVGFIPYEVLNKKAAYEVKRHIFPFPECAFFKVGDILRENVFCRFQVKDVFLSENGTEIMVKAKSLNDHDHMRTEITHTELEMMTMYRLETPAEFINQGE